MEKIMGHRNRRTRKYSGGYLRGPSHERGGIAANAGGIPIEMEGGEYVISKPVVDALGVGFFDKLNSTASPYFSGGFKRGQLTHLGSNYKRGGRINGRRNMRRRNMSNGGSTNPYISRDEFKHHVHAYQVPKHDHTLTEEWDPDLGNQYSVSTGADFQGYTKPGEQWGWHHPVPGTPGRRPLPGASSGRMMNRRRGGSIYGNTGNRCMRKRTTNDGTGRTIF